ncbi:MAG: hypothetical protein ACOX0P_02480 [Candidatus Dojkabacteria bacterium]|jgi:hypothetical protein
MNIIYRIHSLFVNSVYASSLGTELSEQLEGLTKVEDKVQEEWIVEKLVQIAVPLAVICVIVLIIYAAYLLTSSQGNPDKVKEGKEILTNAIIGFLVILLSVVILILLSGSLGLNIYS